MNRDELSKALTLLRKGDWQAAHRIVQRDEVSPLACWAHGIVHLMEGDTSNARYWYREAKREFPRQPSISEEIDSLDAALNS
jgi:hypothetical protein